MEISAVNNKYNVALKSQNEVTYPNTMQAYPAVDSSYGEEDSNNKLSLGLMGLGVLGLAGIAYGVVKHKGVADLKNQVTKLTD